MHFANSPDKPVMVMPIMAAWVFTPYMILSLTHGRTRYAGQNPSAGSRKYYSLLCFTVCHPIAIHSGVVEIKINLDLSCVYGPRAYSIWNRCVRTSGIPPGIFGQVSNVDFP